MNTRIRLALATATLVTICAGRVALADQTTPQTAPTPTPDHGAMQHSTSTPGATTSTPEPSASNAESVMYADDFTDPLSGWPNALVFDNYYVGYHEPEFFHVEVRTPRDKAIVVAPKQAFDDFTAEAKVFVDPSNTNPSGDFRYGLVFRRAGSQYYAFVISPRTGAWSVLKASPNGVTELAKGSSDAIQGLKTPDVLRVDAKGTSFAFHINDTVVGQLSDAEYAKGELGFMVETADSSRAHIHYDDLVVRKADVPSQACKVVVGGLNIRQGPGTGFPILGYASAGAVVEPIGRSADGGWLNVRVNERQDLWISSAPVYVTCPTPIGDLPVR